MVDYLPSHRSALVCLDAHCVGLHSSQVRDLHHACLHRWSLQKDWPDDAQAAAGECVWEVLIITTDNDKSSPPVHDPTEVSGLKFSKTALVVSFMTTFPTFPPKGIAKNTVLVEIEWWKSNNFPY